MPQKTRLQPANNVNASDLEIDNNDTAMDIDSAPDVFMGSDDEFEEKSEEETEKEKETSLSTYLNGSKKEFVPYSFDPYTNSLTTAVKLVDHSNPETARKWYCSTSIKVLKNRNNNDIPQMEAIASFKDKKFWVESAVAGGRCYRLLLGKLQPKMKVCQGEAECRFTENNRTYRLSKEVINFRDWSSLSYRHSILNNQKPIIGLTAIFLISYFLGDIDMESVNYGLVEFTNFWQAVKIDPECCFSHPFYNNKDISILIYIERLSNIVPQGRFNKLELFEALSIIITTTPEAYKEIIDKSISPEYKNQQQIYLEGLSKRTQSFYRVAYSIEGFAEYFYQRQITPLEREQAQYERYKEFERNFAIDSVEQAKNQQQIEQFCTNSQQNFSNGTNSFAFFNGRNTQPTTQQYVTPQEVFPLCSQLEY